MTSTLSFKDAALKILAESGRPLSAEALAVEAIARSLIKTSGATPAATMAAQIYTDLKNNESSQFIKIGKGLFSVRSNSAKDKSPEQVVQDSNKIVVDNFKKKLHEMDPFLFEQLIGDLLSKLGYENVIVTKRSGDGGIDVTANLRVHGLTNVKTVVQVKRYKENVQDKVVRELRGAAEVDQRGLIITTSDFTGPAKVEAEAQNKMPISLVNGDKLIELLRINEVGFKSIQVAVLSIDNEYFKELEDKDVTLYESEKRYSLWPLPGGIDKYYESMIEIINVIPAKGIDKAQLINWFKSKFENVESERTINGYLGVVRSLDIAKSEKQKISLTDNGVKFKSNPSKANLYTLLNHNIFGIDELLELVNQSPRPINEMVATDYLNTNFGLDWKSNAQATYRLLWLWNLGKIARNENGEYEKIA